VLKNPFGGIRKNYFSTQTAAYFVELIEICTERDHREPELFALLHRAFSYLDANMPNLRAVTHFETELATYRRCARSQNMKKRSSFRAGQFIREIAHLAHAALENVIITDESQSEGES